MTLLAGPTHAQRLAWDYDDVTNGYEADPCLDEVFEERDNAFRHWDTMTFARAAARPLGVERASGAAVVSSGTQGGSPETCPADDSQPAGGAAVFPPGDRSALPCSEEPVEVRRKRAPCGDDGTVDRMVHGRLEIDAPPRWTNWLWAA